MLSGTAAFIVGSTVSSRRRRDHGKRERTHASDSYSLLSQSSVLQGALQAAGVDAAIAFAPDSKLHHCILGIVRLTPGTYYKSWMTRFNSQEMLLWQTLQCGDDAFSAKVIDVCALRNPIAGQLQTNQ